MRRKHRRLQNEAELDITAFMNLMIVLVPVLLLSMVFAHTAVLELNFPKLGDNSEPLINEDLQLQLIVRESGLNLADSKGGLIKKIPRQEGEYNYEALSSALQAIKTRVPDKTDIAILLEEDIPYQTLVTVMDTTRSYEAVVAASLVEAELFPDMSIGDAPELSNANAGGGS